MISELHTHFRWHIFCKVIDNFGDIGVCWRLACDLATRGKDVCLWVDDASALAWLAPNGHSNVVLIDCSKELHQQIEIASSDILLDTFGSDFAINIIASHEINTPSIDQNDHVNSPQQPVWLNLEHLTAESFAERNHTLPTIRRDGVAQDWLQHYFYPGFNDKTGGLLRENDLLERQQSFNRQTWLASYLATNQLKFDADTSYISLFCYEPSALQALIDELAKSSTPTCLLVTAGRATVALQSIFNSKIRLQSAYSLPKVLSIVYLPWLPQTEYDHLLWSCDLNFVRGEDSLVRAIWAGKPFVWQIYQQDDGAHHAKLEAFLHMMDAPESLKTMHRAWNADIWVNVVSKSEPCNANILPALDIANWAQSARFLRKKLLQQTDFCAQLIDYVDTLSQQKQKNG